MVKERDIAGVSNEIRQSVSNINRLRSDIRWKEQEVEKEQETLNKLRLEFDVLIKSLQDEIKSL